MLTDKNKVNKKIFDYAMICLIFFVGFIFVFKSGERGFFAFDQSIVFDGGYRLTWGEVPYKDFLIPFGPVVFYLQAFFSKYLE